MRKLLICEKNGVPNHNSQGKQFLGSPHSDSIFFCSPREEIQASPETFRKKSAKSTKSFSAFCHLRGGLPHVCGFEGAVAHTWFLLMNQRLDGALFLTLENYSLMHFKEILMRTLEAQGTQLGRFSFQFHEVWCYLISPASLSLSRPCLRGGRIVSAGLIILSFTFFLSASGMLISPKVLSTASFWILFSLSMQGFVELKTFSGNLPILNLLTRTDLFLSPLPCIVFFSPLDVFLSLPLIFQMILRPLPGKKLTQAYCSRLFTHLPPLSSRPHRTFTLPWCFQQLPFSNGASRTISRVGSHRMSILEGTL